MSRRIAITREVSPGLGACELTHVPRVPIDLALARAQHCTYEHVLAQAGFEIRRLSAGPEIPDSVFVEDIAVVFPELAVVMRPGAPSRRLEVADIAEAVRAHRPLEFIQPPATMDGGDVLVTTRGVFVGRSTRTTATAADQLRRLLAPFGLMVWEVEVRSCLHLKSAVTEVADGVLLSNPEWVDAAAFRGFEMIAVHPSEPSAANALRLDAGAFSSQLGVGPQRHIDVLASSSFPRTRDRLVSASLQVSEVDMSELAKAEGAVTCCSLLIS